MFSQNTLLFQQLCAELCSSHSTFFVIVRLVGGSTFVEECRVACVKTAVLLVEVFGGCGHIHKTDMFLFSQLSHVVGIVHVMVVAVNVLLGHDSILVQSIKLIAQIVLSGTCYLVVSTEITSAYG